MGAFKSKKIIYGDPSRIPYIAEEIRKSFMSEGFEVRIVDPNRGNEIYITKGGLFKAALGLRSALKVVMKPNREGNIDFEAGNKHCQAAVYSDPPYRMCVFPGCHSADMGDD